jgi:hypothetical protein
MAALTEAQKITKLERRAAKLERALTELGVVIGEEAMGVGPLVWDSDNGWTIDVSGSGGYLVQNGTTYRDANDREA